MKKYAAALVTAFFVLVSSTVMAQENLWKPLARGQSTNGHWVVEVNKETPEVKLVSFYSKDNSLIYKEEVRGTKINVNKEKTIKRMAQLLNTIAIEWERAKAIAGTQLVQAHFN